MSAAAVAAAIVTRAFRIVKFVTIGCLSLGVHPGVEFAHVDRLSLPADPDNLQEGADLRVEYGAAHGQVRGCFTDSNQSRR